MREMEKNYDNQLKSFLEDQGYKNIRILPDGIVCTNDFMFTRAVLINVDYEGYEKRYCYKNRELADKMCLSMTSIYDEPLPGFTAIK